MKKGIIFITSWVGLLIFLTILNSVIKIWLNDKYDPIFDFIAGMAITKYLLENIYEK